MFDLTTEPYYWNSPYHPVTFEWDYEVKSVSGKTDVGGYVQFNLGTGFTTTPIAGQKVIVENTASLYYGIHVITAVSGVGDVDITTSTPYVVDATGISLKFMEIYEIELYKGYDAADTHLPADFDTDQPLTLIATFTPENSASNNVSIDISGFLKNIFPECEFPNTTLSTSGIYDLALTGRFRLKYNGTFQDYYHVLNCGIDSDILCIHFLDTGRPLQGVQRRLLEWNQLPSDETLVNEPSIILYATCTTYLSKLDNNGVYHVIAAGDDIINP